MIKIEIVEECGYNSAMEGLSYNFNTSFEKAEDVSLKLYDKDHGHNKFMRFLFCWIRITAPRYWWSQFDQYSFATTNSESTMHTLLKTQITQEMFATLIPQEMLENLEMVRRDGDLERLKGLLPESFLQKRMVVTNYAQLREMIIQRRNHKLSEWQEFCEIIPKIVEHKEFFNGK